MPLLRVGLVIPRMSSVPVVSALLSATTPVDLFERWGRLERFMHSRHRVVLTAQDNGAYVEHVGPPGTPPEPAEDALVLGVLAVLLTLIGAQDLVVTAGPRDHTVFAHGEFVAPLPEPGTGQWRFGWAATTSRARTIGPHRADDVVSRARGLLARDLGRRWSVDGIAVELGISTRSLQRRLREEGGFQGLLGAVRTEAAAHLLVNSPRALSAIGFVCGYADQPHFTREFKHRTAMTPAVYRRAFSHQSGENTWTSQAERFSSPAAREGSAGS